MKKLLLYPYQRELSPFIRFRHLLGKYKVIPVSPKGWVEKGEDANYFDGGPYTEIKVESSFEKVVTECDVVFFAHYKEGLPPEKYINYIHLALKKKKHIKITKSLIDHIPNHGLNLSNPQIEIVGYNNEQPVVKNNKLASLNIPLIYIISSGSCCNKFEILISIGNRIRQRGYNVMEFSEKEYSSLFGVQQLPRFIFSNKPLPEKILMLNRYFEQASQGNPDIIISTVPGQFVRNNPIRLDDFGEYSIMFSNAHIPDITIASLSYDIYDESALYRISETCKFKYNFVPEYINIANSKKELGPNSEMYSITMPYDSLNENIASLNKLENYYVFNSYYETQIEMVANSIINKLS